MSRIGVKPVEVPKGVTVTAGNGVVEVTGPKGSMHWAPPPFINVSVSDDKVKVDRKGDEKPARAMHGTARSLIANMVKGVNEGFERKLQIEGVGFRAQIQGRDLTMSLGYSHPVNYTVPEDVTVAVSDGTKISVAGVDKQKVGLVSAQIRSYCPAEPYKGKGIRYSDENVRRKAGKTVA